MLTREYPKTLHLKDDKSVVLRPLAEDDFDRLLRFFQGIPEEDRLFLADDVTDPDLIRKWTGNINFERVIPLVALDEDRIVGDGTLHMASGGWARHVGHIRLVTARTHRHSGLGTLLARDLVALAAERNLEKLMAHVIEDSEGAVRMFQAVGFEKAAVVRNLVKDLRGQERNLAIMINDVASLTRALEDWIQDSMVPQFRAPGEG
ncbi:MAG: GNAT family N-acetyltransferase [Phycisphaerae bacterium]|nr:GNAT family N-acetyltransferase [Phycisphaerae bacterium]